MFQELKGKKWLVWVLVAAGELALLLLVFRIGEVIGVNRANFDAAWGQNYVRFFGQPRPGFFEEVSELPPPIPAFGNTGVVLTVGQNMLVMQDNRMNEKTIAISSSTTIREGTETIDLNNIPAGANIVVIGAPSKQGEINARFIRVFPEEMDSSSTGY